MSKPETFASRLRTLREEKGISAYRLAQLTGLTRQALSLMELGQTEDPSWETIKRLAVALEVSTDAFVTKTSLVDAPPAKRRGRPRKVVEVPAPAPRPKRTRKPKGKG
jgi:transcriptional regulator with XRE-family HTH domain